MQDLPYSISFILFKFAWIIVFSVVLIPLILGGAYLMDEMSFRPSDGTLKAILVAMALPSWGLIVRLSHYSVLSVKEDRKSLDDAMFDAIDELKVQIQLIVGSFF